jgi:NADPH2:quinone reductase
VRALTIRAHRLEVDERPVPSISGDELLVHVQAAGLNRPDLWRVAGGDPAPPGVPDDVPGLEFAGEVVAAGSDTRRFRPGNLVMGLTEGGGHAEYVAVAESRCVAVPRGMEMAVAGAVPESFVAAHDALITQAGLRRGSRVLIHAVASGTGLAALQVAKLYGCEVAGTTRSAEKIDPCRALGVDRPLQMSRDELPRDWADVVVDLVGGQYLAIDLDVAAPRGWILLMGTMGGTVTPIDLRRLSTKGLTLRGSTLRGRSTQELATAMAAFERDLSGPLADGRLRPVIAATFSLEEAPAAYDLLRSNQSVGKIVLLFDR